MSATLYILLYKYLKYKSLLEEPEAPIWKQEKCLDLDKVSYCKVIDVFKVKIIKIAAMRQAFSQSTIIETRPAVIAATINKIAG